MAGSSLNSNGIRKSNENFQTNSSQTGSSRIPQCAETIKQLFQEANIKEYEPQLIIQVCDIAYALTKEILLEARSVSEFSGKKQVDRSDIDFALQVFNEKHRKDRPPKSFIAELTAEKNAQPLPPIRQNFGLRLPNDRFCQLQPNYAYVENDKTNPEQPDNDGNFEHLTEKRQPIQQRTDGLNIFGPEAVSSLLSGNVNNQRKRQLQEETMKQMVTEDEDYD